MAGKKKVQNFLLFPPDTTHPFFFFWITNVENFKRLPPVFGCTIIQTNERFSSMFSRCVFSLTPWYLYSDM
jgi:hypothetical protein